MMLDMESFIVRVVPGDNDDIRGVLRRVTDGWETTFADGDELLTLLRTPGPSPSSEPSQGPA